jgi:hypothetical protein
MILSARGAAPISPSTKTRFVAGFCYHTNSVGTPDCLASTLGPPVSPKSNLISSFHWISGRISLRSLVRLWFAPSSEVAEFGDNL